MADRSPREVLTALDPVRSALETGRGFAIVEGWRAIEPSGSESCLYWIVGRPGSAVRQNVQGTMLYDVRRHRPGRPTSGPLSVTNYESAFTPTIRSAPTSRLRRPAGPASRKNCGRSQVLSGSPSKRVVRPRTRTCWRRSTAVPHCRRGWSRDGDSRRSSSHHAMDGTRLLSLLRYWIEAGHEKIGTP